jgi:hypothetical protein
MLDTSFWCSRAYDFEDPTLYSGNAAPTSASPTRPTSSKSPGPARPSWSASDAELLGPDHETSPSLGAREPDEPLPERCPIPIEVPGPTTPRLLRSSFGESTAKPPEREGQASPVAANGHDEATGTTTARTTSPHGRASRSGESSAGGGHVVPKKGRATHPERARCLRSAESALARRLSGLIRSVVTWDRSVFSRMTSSSLRVWR